MAGRCYTFIFLKQKVVKTLSSNEQESFWQGAFGDEYIKRNQGGIRSAADVALFCKLLLKTQGIQSVLELGANVGLNLDAIQTLLPEANLAAVEINKKAADRLQARLPDVDVFNASIHDFETDNVWDFVFTKGVLIHIAPSMLDSVYELMYRSSSRYISVVEYYNPQPVEIMYRGHSGKLFKRDFAGELLDKYADLTLVDYAFSYHRDVNFPQDDLSWFLLEKKM